MKKKKKTQTTETKEYASLIQKCQLYANILQIYKQIQGFCLCWKSQIRGLFANCPVSVKSSLSFLLIKSFSNTFLCEGFCSVCVCAGQPVQSSVNVPVQTLVKYKGKPFSSWPISEISRNIKRWSLCVLIQCTFLPPSLLKSHWHFSYPHGAAFNQWFSTQPMRYATTLQQATCICPWGQRIWVCVSLFLSVIINHTPIYIHKYLYSKRKLPSALSDLTLSQWILMAAKHNLVLLKTQKKFWIS